MIRQAIGDILEIREGGKRFYVVVLTKVVLFGGNIAFAFHNDGKKRRVEELTAEQPGFNICTDLLFPKREGRVERLAHLEDVSGFWRTKLVKASTAFEPGAKAKAWYFHPITQLGGHGKRVERELTRTQREAMDDGCHSFDLVAEKVLARYTPDQNEHL